MSSCCGGSTTSVKIAPPESRKVEIRADYAAAAEGERGLSGNQALSDAHSESLGYSREELEALPDGTNLGLGCGNPTALASIKAGEVVVDLGSGAGIDCLLAAKNVGASGKVIGVDMTPEMIEKARANATAAGAGNVEFRLGEIEHLPIADNSVDLVISNCVINLADDKGQVFKEIHRVLKPGGRIAISDTATREPLTNEMLDFVRTFVGCGEDTLLVDEYATVVQGAGLRDVAVDEKGSAWIGGCDSSAETASDGIGIDDVRRYLTSVAVTAVK